MTVVETLPALSRLSFIIDALCKAVLARTTLPKIDRRSETTLPLPLVLAVMRRLRRAEAVIRSLAVRFHAGLLKPPAQRAASAKPRARPTKPALMLPHHFAWLCPLVPCEAAIRGNHLRILLEEPEMQAVIAASPRAVRILRPVYRMLGVQAPVLSPSAPAASPDAGEAAPLTRAVFADPPKPSAHAPPPHPHAAGPPGTRPLFARMRAGPIRAQARAGPSTS